MSCTVTFWDREALKKEGTEPESRLALRLTLVGTASEASWKMPAACQVAGMDPLRWLLAALS